MTHQIAAKQTYILQTQNSSNHSWGEGMSKLILELQNLEDTETQRF